MCKFIDEMERLKSSSSSSVANEEFSDFNQYMHISSKMDERLISVIEKALTKRKALVLVCGNSGDGKSHIIASLIKRNIIKTPSEFEVYIDATSSDRKGMKANEKLKEKLSPFMDENILDEQVCRMVIAINLGVLNDFIKNYEDQFKIVKKYIEEQGLFDNLPAWKFVEINSKKEDNEKYFLGHVDFTSFHRYEINVNGLDVTFIQRLLNKITSNDEKNQIYQAFEAECEKCLKRTNCPAYWNYSSLVKDKNLRAYIIDILSKAMIKNNLAPSVREINNFFYEIIIGNTFDYALVDALSIDRYVHFIHNLSLWTLFEASDGLLEYTAKEDPLNNPKRFCDKEIISLNMKPNFKKWLTNDAIHRNEIFKQIYSNVIFCESNPKLVKTYRYCEAILKRDVYKYFIRIGQSKCQQIERSYSQFLHLIYEYNKGNEKGCAEIINLIKDCIYLWNGRLGEKTGGIKKNGVIFGKGTRRYYLYKCIEVQFSRNTQINSISDDIEFPNFTTIMRFDFILKNKPDKKITLDIDYELYAFLLEVKNGYIPTNSDKKLNVKYDSFVRNLLDLSDSALYVYSKFENGDSYKISCDEFGSYVFEREG